MLFIYVCLSSTYGHLLLLEVDGVDVDLSQHRDRTL